jgi:hypothetical protein
MLTEAVTDRELQVLEVITSQGVKLDSACAVVLKWRRHAQDETLPLKTVVDDLTKWAAASGMLVFWEPLEFSGDD